jgi:DNA polymerase II large subunit
MMLHTMFSAPTLSDKKFKRRLDQKNKERSLTLQESTPLINDLCGVLASYTEIPAPCSECRRRWMPLDTTVPTCGFHAWRGGPVCSKRRCWDWWLTTFRETNYMFKVNWSSHPQLMYHERFRVKMKEHIAKQSGYVSLSYMETLPRI